MATQVDICNLALRRIGAQEITAIDEGSKNADHCNTFWDYVLNEVLEDYPWKFAKKNRTLDYTAGFGVYLSTDTKTITNITQASEGVVTCTGHGLLTGHTVYIDDVSGMTELNQLVFEIEKVDADSFKLTDIDTTQMTAYTSGGTCIRLEADPKYANGYTYDLPSDYLYALRLIDDTEFEVFETENNTRLCTTTKDAVLVYISNETTTTNMFKRFINALAWRMAADLAVPLGKPDGQKKQSWALGMYNYVLGKTTTRDARSEKQELDDSDSWIDAGGFTV